MVFTVLLSAPEVRSRPSRATCNLGPACGVFYGAALLALYRPEPRTAPGWPAGGARRRRGVPRGRIHSFGDILAGSLRRSTPRSGRFTREGVVRALWLRHLSSYSWRRRSPLP